MNRPTDPWADRLSEYLDGSLEDADTRALEEHLEGCPECRQVLDELDRVRAQARSLPHHPPERDLWGDIRAAIEGAKVIDLDDHRDAWAPRDRGARGVFLSVRQLATAAALVTVAAGGTAWALARATAPVEAPASVAASVEASADPVRQVALGDPRLEGFVEELTVLEGVLAAESSRLDPNTVRILEKNLEVIDRAIRESVDALAVDPGNPFVEDHLRRSVERKVTYLREAAILLNVSD